jgi:methionyl-tRNA synthetase
MNLTLKNHGGVLAGTAGVRPGAIVSDMAEVVRQVQGHVEACQYNQALQKIWLNILNPANKYVEDTKPWALFKSDPEASKRVLYELAEVLRVVSILLKPFLPRAAETIYTAFNFPTRWETVRYEDAATWPAREVDLCVAEGLREGTVKPLFPRIDVKG